MPLKEDYKERWVLYLKHGVPKRDALLYKKALLAELESGLSVKSFEELQAELAGYTLAMKEVYG